MPNKGASGSGNANLRGFALAPLAGGVVAVVWSLLWIVAVHNTDYADSFVAAPLGVFVGYAGMAVFGVPAYFVMHRLGWTSRWMFGVTGFVLGTVVFGLIPSVRTPFVEILEGGVYSIASFSHPLALLVLATEGGAVGVGCALTFWLIARPRGG